MDHNVLYAFLLTLLAGLSTAIGSLIAFFTKTTNKKFISVTLGFSAGVMIYVSMVEILPDSKMQLTSLLGAKLGAFVAAASFFGGIFIMALVDKLIPSYENPHEVHGVEELSLPMKKITTCKLMRTGKLVAIGITIHNFPEGIATFSSALHSVTLGLPIALAIALHNIPEGISVSIPIYCATGSKRKAFFYSMLSGLSEPLGAVIAYFTVIRFLNGPIFGIMFAAVAGIMVFISFDELLPASREFGEHHLSIYGLVTGMLVMALSMFLFI